MSERILGELGRLILKVDIYNYDQYKPKLSMDPLTTFIGILKYPGIVSYRYSPYALWIEYHKRFPYRILSKI